MNRNLLLGIARYMLPVPRMIWQGQVSQSARHGDAGLGFMTPEHHLVRNFVVRELPRVGKPLTPDFIAQSLNLPIAQVTVILDELEKHMTFLFRNEQGAVAWAYPVTVDVTPHRVVMSTGEQVHAAWAIDAIAVPFVQGQLRGEPLSVNITTECAHCHRPLHIEIDSQLNYRVVEQEAGPLILTPLVDFDKLSDPSIIDAFWRNSIFFWSEEHAREHRRRVGAVRGTYLTLPQSVYVTPILQGALFAFGKH